MSEIVDEIEDGIAENPFVVEAPEKLSPHAIVRLFIPDYTRIDIVQQRRHTFIWGSRGSGKSMMLRYLEPRCQAIHYGSMVSFLEQRQPFFAVYCPCKEGHFDKEELKHLDEASSLIISEHMLNLAIADRLITTLRTQMPNAFISEDEYQQFAHKVPRFFDRISIRSSTEEASERADKKKEPLEWLQTLIAIETRKVSRFLLMTVLSTDPPPYDGATSGYHDFLLPLMKAVQEFKNIGSIPVYILLDDADRLTIQQQSIINTWIANRDQAYLCLKISAQRENYGTFRTRSDRLIEQPHDYSEVDVEELYTRSKSDYYHKVRLIAQKRLELSGMPTQNIHDYLPSDPTEQELLKIIRAETADEWHNVGERGRQRDYVDRYSIPRLFQKLAAAKQPKSYAGFDNLVDLSSGVVRDFLDPCYLMFSTCISKGFNMAQTTAIPPGIQNEVIYKYSQEFLLTKFEDIRRNLAPESWNQWEAVRTLIESFGRLFYQRLHDPQAREARLFSFTVRSRIAPDLEEILRLAVKYRYLQLGTYSTKEGGGRERWYILNRRLCPMYKLDPTGFAGRISVTPELLRIATEDPTKFVRRRLKNIERDTEEIVAHQLTLFPDSEDIK